jgi:hypothetical protein
MRLIAASFALALVTCSDPSAQVALERTGSVQTNEAVLAPPKIDHFAPVILVTVDGVRWQDFFGAIDETLGIGDARMPVLRSLVLERGAALGAPGRGRMDASGPNFVSMPGYTEIFTGGASRCMTNECERPDAPTFLERLAAQGAHVAVFSSWERIGIAASRAPNAFFVSSGRDRGDESDPFPGSGAYRPDARTSALALEYLRERRPDVLVVALGDPDEHAHHGDRNGYLRALEQVDAFIGDVEGELARMGERGRETHLFVTTDHGRSNAFRDHGGAFPESSRVWLAAEGPRVASRGLVATRSRHLADVAGTIVAVATNEDPESHTALTELFTSTTLGRHDGVIGQ